MKKMLSLFLVYAMIFSVFPAGYAETEFDQIIVQAEEPTSLQQNGVEKELTQESLGNVADFPKYYNADVKPQPVYGEMGDGVQIADRGTTVYSVTLRPANGGIDSLTYNVTAPVSGKYALSVRSYSWAEASPVITVNGETVVLQNAIPNNGYSTNGENVWSLANKEGQDIFTETTIAEVTLVRGQNTITFKTPAAFFFDSFYLTPTEVEEIEYYIDGVKANGIKTGELLIVVNHGSYVDGKTVVGAIYENQHLKSTALTALDGKTTAFNFGSFVADAEKIYEFKYFVFADMENLIPATKEGAALIVQQAEAFSSYTFSGTDYTSMNAARTAYHAVYNQVIANYVSAKTDNIHGATIDEDNWIDFNGYGTAWAYDLIVRKAGAPLANYTINAEKAGIYTLTMMTGSWNADATPVVYVNGKAATVSPLRKNLTSWGDSGDWYAANAVADIYLDSGANTISIGTADADYYFDSMQLSYKHEAGEVPPTATPTSMPAATPTSTPTAPPTPTPTAEPTATPAMTADIYVSPYGNDANPGSASAPVKTVAKAQSLAREKDKAEYTIYLNSGIYYLDDTLALTEADNNLTITGPSDGSAVISGGKEVSGWTSAGNGIYYANVDTDDVREFYVNEKPAILAKNKASLSGTGGRLRAVSASAAGITVNTGDISGIADPAGSELVFDILWDRLILKVTGVTNNGDGTTTLLISDKVWRDYYAYYAVAKNQWVNEPCSESGYSTTRYYYWIQNNFSLLDEPGEFYFDRDAKRLYYYPRSGEVMPNADCYVGYLTTVISDTNSKGIMTIQGAENITIENIAFEGGTFLYPSTYSVLPKSQEGILWTASDNGGSLGTTMPAQISVQYSSGITFDHIMMRNCAANGISLGLGAADCMIQNSTFTQIGGGAVTVGDHRCADKQTTKEIDGVLTGVSAGTLLNSYMAHDNIITNNVIRDVAKVYAMCSGIKLWHSYNISVTHNTVEDTGYSGVSVGWGWHAIRLSNSINAGNYDISYNKIVNVCNVLEDGANIYTLGIVPKGGTISNNYLSRSYDGMNTIPAGSKYGWHGGIYCDEGSRNWTITNNVVEDTYQWLNSRRGAANTNIIARDNWGTAPHPRTDITGDNAFYSGKVTIDYNFDGIKETDNSTTVTNYVQAADNNWSAYPAAQQVVDAAGAR